MPNVVDLTEVADEGESSLFDGTFVDLANETIDKQAIQTLELTLQNEMDGQIINDRENVDVLDRNGGVLDDDGSFRMNLTPEDNAIVRGPRGIEEAHIMTYKWTWLDSRAKVQEGTQKYRLKVAPALAVVSDPVDYPDSPI